MYTGLSVYVGGTLCGKFPDQVNFGSFQEIKCPNNTVGTNVRLEQKKDTNINTCGIEIYGKGYFTKSKDPLAIKI